MIELTYLIKDDIIKGEIWKEIKGYEGLYEVSNLGRIKSLPRKGTKGGIMTQHTRKDKKHKKEYLRVPLSKNHNTSWYSVNRLVAEAFLENPDNLPEVDHINNNEKDNRVCNLQWIDRKSNIRKNQAKRIMCVETGEIFESITDAYLALGKTKNFSAISEVLNNKNRTAYSYHWQEV